MAKLSDLVLSISEVTGVRVPTVREISRRLREGGLIRTGKGGRYGGADMSPNDAARLITALLIVRASGVSLTDIVSHTRTYLGLQSHGARGRSLVLARWSHRIGLPELTELKPGHTFEDALTGLIISFSNRRFEQMMDKWGSGGVLLTIESPTGFPHPEARIHLVGDRGRVLYYVRRAAAKILDPKIPTKWSDIYEGKQADLGVQSYIGPSTLKVIGSLLQNAETTHVYRQDSRNQTGDILD
jgi:hypothetical protein